ncbi:MAG: sulfotransferase [Bacteroidia bacterium]|nr:sulfotransferase [Bacteroidia bacterium]
MNKIIILLGQRVRSGTNFVGSTIAQHPDVMTIPPDRSFGEFNLFTDDTIVSGVYNKVIAKSFASGIREEDLSSFLKRYGVCWMDLIIEKFKIPENKNIFIKSPDISHADLWKQAFPEARIALICRDGRDNVISSVKASNDKKTWHSAWTNLKRRLNYFSGRSFVNHSRMWNLTAKKILKLNLEPGFMLFKYESLLNSEEQIGRLLDYFNLQTSPEIVKKCLDAPIVGSSFGGGEKGKFKSKWESDHRKEKYQFTNKWNGWGLLKKVVFKRIAGKSLIDLEYESDGNW